MSNPPRILDSTGTPLKVGDWVQVGPDRSIVRGFEETSYGWRVQHFWMTGYHPDEGEPSEYTERTGEPSTLRCPDLTRITDQEEKRDD